MRRPSSEPRKVAILGGCDITLKLAPWHDPTWKLWAHASCRQQCERMPDLLFDLHPKELWTDPVKKHWDPHYQQWLRQSATPIYMQQRYPEAPASMAYPRESILAEFGAHPYFANTLAWMVALALSEGVTHIAVYGCEYASGSEYGRQRGSAEFWLGVAIGRGVQVCLPPTCTLLRDPRPLYGYESHPNGVRDPAYRARELAKPTLETPSGPAPVALTIEPDPSVRPTLRPVLGPDGQPTGEEPAWERRGPSVPQTSQPRIYTATSARGTWTGWTGAGVGRETGGPVLTWQGIRALASCELWDGSRITAPYRDWPPHTPPRLAPAAALTDLCYTRQPWLTRDAAALQDFAGVLLTAFCDVPVTQALADAVLAGPIAHWFAVQAGAVHPKLTAMPIGIDRRDVGFLDAAPRAADRDILLYANLTPHTTERRALMAKVQNWAHQAPGKLTMPEYFAMLGRSRFVLSPPGLAWDCYRTYEALAMGAIPIVRRAAPLSDVVQGLPVLMVDDWSEVTPERLQNFTPPTWDLRTMTLAYWTERIQRMARTYRSRTEAYDNIAVGSAITSQERTIPDPTGLTAGALPPDTSVIPGTGENIAVGSDYGAEKVVTVGITLLAVERLTP